MKKPLRAPTSVCIFLLIVALVGFADAAYLTIEHFQGAIPPCTATAGCEVVLTSAYSVVAGIPVSLAGAVFYLLMLIGIFYYIDTKNGTILKWTMLLTILGFAASLWFVFVQVFILHSYCMYCLGSALTSTVLFVSAMEVFARNHRNTNV